MGKGKIVMGLSGGMDSSTLLGYLLSLGHEVHCCLFTYGSKHNKYENQAALDVASFYQKNQHSVITHGFDFSNLTSQFKSNLLLSGGEIPEGHYNDENMKKTVVPGRNLIFISLMAGLAESIEADTVVLGVHAGDHHIYPDCRAEFISSAKNTVELSTDGKVTVSAPFQEHNKKTILEVGYHLGIKVPYHLTRTCYKDQPYSCGKCGSCQERLEAFELIGKTDPIPYATY
jgi:7-cyano-7-deazaguanine synthase